MGLGNRYRRSAVGLTVGHESITMVRVTMSRSGPVVEKALVRAIPEPRGEAEIARALAELVAQEKIRGHELSIAVPRNEITTRIVTLPSSDEGELHQMVQLEVEELVPYSADELEVDEAMLRQLHDGSSTVLVAIAHRDVVEKPIAVLAEAGIRPARIDVSCFALYNAFMSSARSAFEQAVALLDVSDLGTDIVVVSDGGRLAFTRGVAHLRAPSATADEVAAELRNSLDAYSRETGGATVERVLLSGSLERLTELARTLTEVVGVSVEEAHYVTETTEVEGAGARYAIQTGLALSVVQKSALDINLIPRRIQKKKEHEEKRKVQLVTLTLAVLVLLVGYLVVNSKLADKRNYVRFLADQIETTEQPARLVKERKLRVDAIRSQLSRKNSALEVLAEIHELAPQGLVLEEITFIRDKDIEISGMCYDRRLAFEYAGRLRNSGVEALAKAEVGDTRNETVENTPVIRFDIIRAPEAEVITVPQQRVPAEELE